MATPISGIRPIPAHPNLEFDRNQAKALLDAAQRSDSDALRRFGTSHPRFETVRDLALIGRIAALHDAQLVVAREYGFASWPRWKQFVELRRLDRAARAAELVKAACSNDVRKARVLLDSEPKLASFDIYAACACGDAEAVEEFLWRDPKSAGRKGGPMDQEPILYACFSRFLRADPKRSAGIVAAVRLVLRRGADANSHGWSDWEGEKWLQSTLYAAGGIANCAELLTMLLDAGAHIDPRDKEALYHTSEFPDPTCLELLLRRGDSPIEQVKYCLGRALDFEYPRHVALFLANGADPNFRFKWSGERTLLHKAVYAPRSAPIVRMLIDAGGDVNAVDASGESILRTARRWDDAEVIGLLIAHGARDFGPGDSAGVDSMALCIAAARDDMARIDRLLDTGADINAGAGGDNTPPLHWAAWRGRLAATRRLVERGADIHWVNGYGAAALGMAIHGSANCFDTEGGPGMRLPEEAVAGEYPWIVEYLISRGAKLPHLIHGGSEPVQEILRRHGVPDAE